MTTSAPLVIGPDQLAALHALRALALLHIVDVRKLMVDIKTPEGKRAHMAQMTSQTVEIPGHPWRFLVTYSVEMGHGAGTCRHMSMSVDRPKRVPHLAAVWMVAEELGFVGDLKACMVWEEKLSGHGIAINVVQPVRQMDEGELRTFH